MHVLGGLKPESVFRFFEEICSIPHGSGHTVQISNYLAGFAEERGLRYRKDPAGNVIIWKAPSPGMEDAPAVMLQGHVDMVAEKEPGCSKNMDTEGLELFVDGDVIGARGTTLGGDDGIAVAMGLAILNSDSIAHGPLECVFTVDEEVGMRGATLLDTTDLKARYLLNLDSEEEKVFTVSCAGAARTVSRFPVRRESRGGTAVLLKVGGLNGGHSGEEIDKGRANSNLILGRAMSRISENCEIRLVNLRGGAKDNAIPCEAEATLMVSDEKAASAAVEKLGAELKQEYRFTDGAVAVSLLPAETDLLPMDALTTERLICFLRCVPNGVQVMSAEVSGLVQTSLNVGRVYMEEDSVSVSCMVRSSVNSQRDEVVERIGTLTRTLGGVQELHDTYSAWEYRPESRLRDIMVQTFRDVYGEEPVVAALHAGLECGVLSGKMPGLDCISYGPELTNIHTPRERLHIASVARVWELTLEVLKRLN